MERPIEQGKFPHPSPKDNFLALHNATTHCWFYRNNLFSLYDFLKLFKIVQQNRVGLKGTENI